MNKIILAGIGVGIIIAIIYFVGLEENIEIQNNQKILEIVDYEIIQKKSSPLFLSVIISENIPPRLDADNYGFGWLSEDSEKLQGYITNIHSDLQWHTESIVIYDADKFCFDEAELVISNVMIKQNKINVIVEINDATNFDRIISYKIIKDNNCHLGYAGIIIDEYKITLK